MLKCTPIRAFSNNYIWSLENHSTQECYIIDPGDAVPVVKYLQKSGFTLKGILITHSHPDHIGGIHTLLETQPNDAPVYGPDCKVIPMALKTLNDGAKFELWPSVKATITHTPGHLPEHIVYFIESTASDPMLFCGDILFSSGCGRIFDGTPAEMHQSLSKLQGLPGETQVFCAHEYTLNNCEFALRFMPDNVDLKAKLSFAQECTNSDTPTLPSTIFNERLTNPFLQCKSKSLQQAVAKAAEQAVSTELDCFAALRRLKDEF